MRQVTVTHSHTIGVSVSFELKAKINLWSIFKEQIVQPIDLSAVLPSTQPPTNQFFTALSGSPAVAAAELPEVVWG